MDNTGTTPVPLGRVTSADGRTVRTLHSDQSWVVTIDGDEVPELGAGLRSLYDDQFQGPQYGAPGAMALEDVARRLGGTSEYLGPYRFDPDVVY